MKKLRLHIFSLLAILTGVLTAQSAGWPSNYGGVMLQGFYWDSYDQSKWTVLQSQADEIAGYFDIVWVPNSGQSAGSPSMGYLPIYWFTNHNSSFGSMTQLRSMIETFRSKNVNVIMDLVLNHRTGVSDWADFPSETWKGKTYKMDKSCICRTDEINRAGNPGGATGANDEGDDFDGGRDLDHTNATVQAHCKAYCDFLLQDLKYAGFRLDMVKGYAGYYTKMYNQHSKPRFSVGEYWDGYDNIANWIESTGLESAAFDFPFKYAVNEAFNNDSYNMEALCWLTNGWEAQPAGLIHEKYRRYAVTFIDNHDTYREGNGSKFTGNPLAAHAFMLCSPGTPCVLLAHWNQYKSEIKNMIAIRKACGITNTSTVRVLQHDGSCYMAEVTGNKGKLVVKVGPAMVSPAGYSDSQIKASGTNWCIWANVNVPTTPGTVDQGSYKVYWDNSAAGWSAPKAHYFGGTESSTWPGVTMTKVSGKSNVYECTVASGTTGLVFNNGSGVQTDDLNAFPQHLYGLTGDKGTFDGNDTGGGNSQDGGTSGTTMTIYFDNRISNWSTVSYYTYPEVASWPGKSATKLYGTLYKCEIPKTTTLIIFNDGKKDNASQTDDIPINAEYANYIFYGSSSSNTGDDGSVLPSSIYLIGNVLGSTNHWKPNKGVSLAKSGNVFRGQVTLEDSGNGSSYFSFVQALASTSDDTGWNTCNGHHRYGAKTKDAAVTANTEADIAIYPKSGNPGGAYSYKTSPGTYYVTADFNTMKVKLEPMSLSLDRATLSLSAGESATLTATALPAELSGMAVAWTSSNTSVATVSTNGKVTGVSRGTAVITASYGTLEVTCTVYVGKLSQSILWSQELPRLAVNETLNLTATSTSGLPVTYTVTNGTGVASISNGILTATGTGVATIQASQPGNDTYQPANPVTKTLTVWLGYIPGDVLNDGSISVDDLTAIFCHILGKPIETGNENIVFNPEAADVNKDGSVDIVDATIVIGLLLESIKEPATLTSPGGSLTIDSEGNCVLTDSDGNRIFQTKIPNKAVKE